MTRVRLKLKEFMKKSGEVTESETEGVHEKERRSDGIRD